MSKLKLLTVIGTRPEIIRLTEIIKLADKSFNHILVHTGQNYDYTLNEIFFNDLHLRKPDYFLDVVGNNLGQTIGNVISKSYDVLVKEKPDALLVLGDTNSVLCTIAAKRLKIPIFHMEAGNRCFDQNVPEEINRKISDHISDVNLTYTEHSRRYLLSEGFRKDHIFVTGSPLFEVLNYYKSEIEKSIILTNHNLSKGKYFVVSAHREENINNEQYEIDQEYGYNQKIEHIMEKGKKELFEKYGYEPTEDQLETYKDDYLKNIEDDIMIEEEIYDLDNTPKGQEVIDQGADYGGFNEYDFETGDGFDYSEEVFE